jgi:hypothetical protein
MAAAPSRRFRPRAETAAAYGELFRQYLRLHDAFGVKRDGVSLHGVMKDLLALRDEQRRSRRG